MCCSPTGVRAAAPQHRISEAVLCSLCAERLCGQSGALRCEWEPGTSCRTRASRLPNRGKCPLYNCGILGGRACSGNRFDSCRGRTTQGQPEGQNAGTANGDASKKIAIIVTKVPSAAPVRSPLLDCAGGLLGRCMRVSHCKSAGLPRDMPFNILGPVEV